MLAAGIGLDQGRHPSLDAERAGRVGSPSSCSRSSSETAAFPDELHFIVWMTMRSGATSGKCREQEYGDAYVSVVGSDELV